jgi:uncharacterized cupredoxin-like copper-binding protein
MSSSRCRVAAAVLGSAVLLLTGCANSDADPGSGTTVDVTATNDSCDVSDTSLRPGNVTFQVSNEGSDVTEVYVYGRDGADFSRIVDEVEDIGPNTSRDLDVELQAGKYEIACKPGQTGDGIRTRVTVTGGRS